MLDDLLDLAADLVGDAAAEFLSDNTKKQREKASAKFADRTRGRSQTGKGKTVRPTVQNRTEGKLTARREKQYGEDPWDWKEEKPPWEG